MKKFILSLGLVAMMLNLTNCAQYEEVTPSVETKGDFALYAPVSRTANDGLNTVWSAGDALNVFHAVTDGTTYTQDGEFKLEDAATGYFLGNLNGTLDPQEEYDWYAMYPYNAKVTTPAATTSGYMTIGCSASAYQTQNGNNSMAHVAGSNYPIVGKAYAVSATSAPSLAMTHVASLVEFEITNSLEEAITVTSIQFTAPEQIVGTFYINYANIDNIVATSSGANYTSSSATLAVTNGVAIAKGASAKFYLPVAPFTAKAGAELAVVVNATSDTGSGVHEKAITLSNDVEFKSGKIKTVKVNYTTIIEAPAGDDDLVGWNLVTDVTTLAEGDQIIIAAKNENYALGTSQKSSNRGAAAITKDGNTIATPGSDVQIITVEAGSTAGTWAFYVEGGTTGYLYAASASGNQLKTKSTLDASGSWNISMLNGAASITASDTSKRNVMQYNPNNGSPLFACYASASQQALVIYKFYGEGGSTPDQPETPATPVLSIDPTALDFTAEGGEKTVTCTIENEVSGVNVTATETVDWLSTSVSGKTVTINATANTATTTRTATVTIAYEGAESKTVNVSQAAASQGGDEPAEKAWVRVTSTDMILSGGTFIIGYEATAKSGKLVPMRSDKSGATTTANGYHYSGTSASTSGNGTIDMNTITDTSAYEFTISASATVSGAVDIKRPDGNYIGNPNSKNTARLYTATSKNTAYGVTISTNDVVTLSCAAASSYPTLQYNTSSPRFANYNKSQKNLVFYKLQ